MRFLTPLFLAGGLVIIAPVIFHLIRRTTRQRTVFSSLLFLQPTPPRLTKRNRLEHILLLLLRCAALGLLATGFARPFIRHAMPPNASAEPPKRMVILLDTSASMRRADLWSQARDKAEALLRKTAPADRVALFTFDRQLAPLITFDQWNAAPPGDRFAVAGSRLAETKPGWSATHMDQALIGASELLAETDDAQFVGKRQIIVISDFQEGSRLSALQGQQWPRNVEVLSERVDTKTSNASLQVLADLAENRPSTANSIRVRVSNEPGSHREQFQVGWAGQQGGFLGKAVDIYVPTGQSRIVALPLTETNARPDRVTLQGDDESFDNTVFTVPPETARLNVVYIGGDSETDPRQSLYFVRRAFQATALETVAVKAMQPSTPWVAQDAKNTTLFILTGTPPEQLATGLREQLALGKTLIFAPSDAAAASALTGFLGQKIAAEEASVRNYAMLGEIDFRHPLFAPFADARYSDFTKIHFWKYRRLDLQAAPDARVIARFDNSDPAIVDIPIGKGRMILLASGWQPVDSQLALSSRFVPLLYSALELTGGMPTPMAQFQVGDAVTFPADWIGVGAASTIVKPDGSSLTLAAGETSFSQTMVPGVYHLKSGSSDKRFVVNFDPAEGRTSPLPLDELERQGAPVHAADLATAHEAQRAAALAGAELENRQKLWRWFIVATLLMLFMETGLAGWTARRPAIPKEAAA